MKSQSLWAIIFNLERNFRHSIEAEVSRKENPNEIERQRKKKLKSIIFKSWFSFLMLVFVFNKIEMFLNYFLFFKHYMLRNVQYLIGFSRYFILFRIFSGLFFSFKIMLFLWYVDVDVRTYIYFWLFLSKSLELMQ